MLILTIFFYQFYDFESIFYEISVVYDLTLASLSRAKSTLHTGMIVIKMSKSVLVVANG